MTSNSDIDALLDASSGGGLPALKFPVVGTKYSGTVTRRQIIDQLKLDGSGEKQKNLVLAVQLDTEHTQNVWDKTLNPPKEMPRTSREWSMWLKYPSQTIAALTEAVRSANARTGSPDTGDRVTVEYYDTKPPSKIGHSPAKLFRWAFSQGTRPGEEILGDLV